jgi:NTP pyrophosphatase (non-canonical NTP hydrolase)
MTFPNPMETLADFQAFHRWMDQQKGFGSDPFFTLLLLTEEVGEVAKVLKRIWWRAAILAQDTPEAAGDARATALAEYREELGQELADCLAYIVKLANNTGIDLHDAYRRKMAINMQRTWTAPPPPARQEAPATDPTGTGT